MALVYVLFTSLVVAMVGLSLYFYYSLSDYD